jgi:hypothetical protein
MTRRSLPWSGIVTLWLVAGCDPFWKIEGTVVDPKGAPVPSASVGLACGGQSPDGRKVTTDASGRFSFGGVGGSRNSASCTVGVAMAGFASKVVKATEVCHRSTDTGNAVQACDPKASTIVLTP